MQQRNSQTRPPASVKHANNFFPSKPYSPLKHDIYYQYYMSENPTPMHQNQKKQSSKDFISVLAASNMINNNKQNKKCRNIIFNYLPTIIANKSKFPISNITTPHNLYLGDMQRRLNNSLQRRLEETYQMKTNKSKANQSFNTQSKNWYLPTKKNSINQKETSQHQSLSFNQTVPHQRRVPKSNQYLNSSLEGQNTGEVSFENNVLQRGFQGDYSGYLQIQSDNSKNEIKFEDLHSSGQLQQPMNQYNPKALELLDKGKDLLRDKHIKDAIEVLKQSIDIDPTLLESYYFLGIGYLGNVSYTKAIQVINILIKQHYYQQFQSIISQDSAHRKNVYLLLAISYKKINELDQAINILTKSLNLFPKYYDALIYRGKLYIKQKLLDKALIDFQNAISAAPQKGLGYLGKADCLRYAGNFKEAIRTYQRAVQCESSVSNAAYLKKAITLFEAKDYDESVRDLNLLLEQDSSNSEAYYFKGLCKMKLKNPQEALLCFEQSIKHNNSKKAVTKSLYEIAKIKIEQRDFYAAYHTLNRADFLDTEKTYLEKFRLFTEAVIFLMKRKFSESLTNFQQIQQNHSLNEFLKPLFYAYRAYGHFCLSNHQKALEDYKALSESIGQLDQGSTYNRLLCEGVIKVLSFQHEKGIEYFEKASKVYPKRMEPLFYQGISLIHKSFHSGSVKNYSEKMKIMLKGLEIIDQAQISNEQNANLYYIRSIIKTFLQNYGDAVQDVDKAIEKSEDNVPKYFYFRGLIYGCSKQYKPAISDFSICINLDENFSDAYLQRAKCHFLFGDSTQAFSDLQTYISLLPDHPNIHIQAGNFLFANAAVEDAIKAYTQAPDFNKNEQLLFLRSECYLVIGSLPECLKDVERQCELRKDPKNEFDKECMKALMIVFRDQQEIYFDEENEEELKDLQRRLTQTIQLVSVLTVNKMNGKLFKQHHLYIFRGVFLFHLHKYEDSLKDFQMAKSQKEIHISEKRLARARQEASTSLTDIFQIADPNSESFGEQTEEEEDADLLEVLEVRFNELACLVMLKQFRKAKDKCKQLIENINEAKQEGLQYLLLSLEREIRKSEGKSYSHLDCDYERVVCLYDEPKENPICFQVPIVSVSFLNNLKFRLSFSLPKISPPSLALQFDRKLVEDLSPLSVENKPEAPWIRRNDKHSDMIMFTDNIQIFDDVRLETEEHEKEERKTKHQQQQEQRVMQDEDQELPIDRNEMKKNLMLDLDVEQKLKKILEKKEKAKSVKK